jgi:hypothetical protein
MFQTARNGASKAPNDPRDSRILRESIKAGDIACKAVRPDEHRATAAREGQLVDNYNGA